MKKTTIFIALLLLIIKAATAQTQKGDQNLGLNLNFYSSTGDYNYQGSIPGSYGSTSTTSFNTNPEYSYFIANNLDIGASLGIGRETNNYNDHTSDLLTMEKTKNYTGTIFLRKYFMYKNKVGIRTGPYLSYQYFTSGTVNTPDVNIQSYYVNGKNYQAGAYVQFVYYPTTKNWFSPKFR